MCCTALTCVSQLTSLGAIGAAVLYCALKAACSTPRSLGLICFLEVGQGTKRRYAHRNSTKWGEVAANYVDITTCPNWLDDVQIPNFGWGLLAALCHE